MLNPVTGPMTAAVLTVSDSCSRGEREDLSGPAVASVLEQNGFRVVMRDVVADQQTSIENKLVMLSGIARFVVTTGGTGITRRDVTPEATLSVCDRLLAGIAEHMRHQGWDKTPYAVLSRGVCGTRVESLILNLPGSPRGAVESLQAVIAIIPHALELLRGNTSHEG